MSERMKTLEQANARLRRRVQELEQAAENSRRAEAQQRALLDAIPDSLFRFDRDGVCLAPDTLRGGTMADVLPDELAAEAARCLAEALSTRRVCRCEYQRQVAGELRDYEARVVATAADDAVVIVRDVSDLKRSAAAALRESEARYRALFEYSPISLWEEDYSAIKRAIDALRAAGVTDFRAYFEAHPEVVTEFVALAKVLDVNEATVNMFRADGKARLLTGLSHVLGDVALGHFHDELLALIDDPTAAVETDQINYTLRGEAISVRVRLSVAPGHEETWGKVFVSLMDVTEQRRAEAALAAERTLLRTLIDNIPDRIFIKDRDGRIILNNTAHARAVGRETPEEVIGKVAAELFPPAARAHVEETDRYVFDSGQPLLNREYHLPDLKGEARWSLLTKIPLFDSHGGVTALLGIARDITERKEAEQSLQRERALLHTLIESLPDHIYVKDEHSRFMLVNAATLPHIGAQSRDKIIGRTDFDFFPREMAARFIEEEQEILRTGRPILNRQRYYSNPLGGEGIWLLITKIPLRDGDGRPVGIIGINRNITELMQTQAKLDAEHTMLRTLIDHLPDAIFVIDAAGHVLLNNPAHLQRIGGLSQDEVLGKTVFDLYPRAVAGEFYRQDRHVIESGQAVFNSEETFVDPQGNTRYLLGTKVPLLEDNGQVTGLIGIYRDITEITRAQEELRALYRATGALSQADNLPELGQHIVQSVVQQLDQADCGLLLFDRARDRLLWLAYAGEYREDSETPVTLDRLGALAEAARTAEIVHDTALDVAVRGEQIRSELAIPLKTMKGVLGVLALRHPDPGHFDERQRRILNAFAERAAAVLEIVRLYEEINRYAGELEWRVAQRTAELERAKERAEVILSNSADAIILTAADGAIHQANPAFFRLFGYGAGETARQTLQTLVQSEEAGTLGEGFRAALAEARQQQIEFTARRKDGTTFAADMHLAPIAESDLDELGVICSIRDITNHKQLESELREALAKEKELNELKSRFITTVSHEFRTPLAGIQTSSDLLKHYHERMSDTDRLNRLNRIQVHIKHLTAMLEDVLTISGLERPGLDFNPVTFDLARLCHEIVAEQRLIAETAHEIVFSGDGDCANFGGDRKLLRQIVTHLLSNAINYSPEGHAVQLRLSCDDEHATITVQDRGIGIPEADRRHLFEAFHRAGNVGERTGTGLGLAIVKQAVEAHGGRIDFETEVDAGTTFTVHLPLSPNTEPPRS